MLALGNNAIQDMAFAKHSVCEVIKIFGVISVKERHGLNFTQTLKPILEIKKHVEMEKSVFAS